MLTRKSESLTLESSLSVRNYMDLSLLETMRVVALPTKTNFRGISLREVALFQGEYGWGEFSHFLSTTIKNLRRGWHVQ